MVNLAIHGRLDSAKSDLDDVLPALVETRASARIQAARDEAPTHTLTVDDDEIVELELEGGIRLWMTADALQRDFGAADARDLGSDRVTVPHVLELGSPGRGLAGWVVEGLKVLGFDVAGDICDFAADKVEDRLQPGPGLYRCTDTDGAALEPVGELRADLPILVFIHGTASSTDGSFGGLWEGGSNARIRELLSGYHDQVLAFQHRSLTLSPLENAVDLVQALPKRARLHLVSHSRGGMLGELLCRSSREGREPFDEQDHALFDGDERDRDRRALKRLHELLLEKELQVERFVRVACPARGTTLADGRLDRYLSVMVNAMGQLPGLKANPAYEAVSSLLLAVVKKRTDPTELPGLEAMMPESPTVRLLNRPDVRSRAPLHVLGGDIAGAGVWGRLKAFVTDLFYREDHDLVVNTQAMFGGAERLGGIRYWIDHGGSVDHFRYFGNADTAKRLTSALLRSDEQAFHTIEQAPADITADDYRKRALEPQPTLFFLPGIMGSHLQVEGERLWLDYLGLAKGSLARLRIDADHVETDGLVADAYGDVLRYMSRSHEVVPFAYDWRRSIEVAAAAFGKVVGEKLDAAADDSQPIRIMAHSMGGLVVRAWLASEAGRQQWDTIRRHPGARFVMLGTPNGGAHAMAAMLIGRDALVRKLALLDLQHSYEELLKVVAQFDGVLELLPQGGSVDLHEIDSWRAVRELDSAECGLFGRPGVVSSRSGVIDRPLPPAERLRRAREVGQRIQAGPIDPERTIYVAGVAPATACDVRVDPGAVAGRRVSVLATAHGDGWVTWATGIPAELAQHQTYYLHAEHGDLANVPETFEALLELLKDGTTERLPRTPPVRRGAPEQTFVLPVAAPTMYPGRRDIVASALGGSVVRATRPGTERTRLRVLHGNLSHVRSPILVGHYQGDTIVSAEAYLDRQLGGRLRELNRLDLYPGELNTTAVVINELEPGDVNTHPGAVVVGLGMIGELMPGGLANTVARGVARYAIEQLKLERARRSRPEASSEEPSPDIGLSLTTLLIGTGSAGLEIPDSLQSILRGVRMAKQSLRTLADEPEEGEETTATPPIRVRIDELSVIELYEDKAIHALQELRQLQSSTEFSDDFTTDDLLGEMGGGRKRAYFSESPSWWQRLRIETQEDGSLKFESLTTRARAETRLLGTQRKLVEGFLSRAAATTSSDPELGYTLFELLLPNELKAYAPDRRNLALVLDAESASYPWELLRDRFDQDARPMSVEAGLVRQLAITTFRAQAMRAVEPNALVIGDPTAADSSGRFATLPGAQEEAREVATLLEAANYEVTERIGAEATPMRVLSDLHARPYRILHLAAHGVFEYPVDDSGTGTTRLVTGLVLNDGMFITPVEIEQMRFVPDLVFVNCCHLGQTKGDARPQPHLRFHRLACNIATQLIRMGVKAVIAAGWAVDDAAAKTFARTFYDRMLKGRSFGIAVVEARREVYDRYPNSNTWGAYQCYGDPGFGLDRVASDAAAGERRFVAAAELRIELENISQKSGTIVGGQEGAEIARLERLLKAAPEDWLSSAATCAAIAKAYGELGRFKRAIHFYERCIRVERADAPVEAMEQLVNLKVRHAARLLASRAIADEEENEENRAEAERLVREAADVLDGLFKIGPTSERHSIKGSLCKRQAILQRTSKRRRAALEEMSVSYREAYAHGKRSGRSDVYYSLQNWLAADIVLSWGSARSRKKAAIEKRAERTAKLSELEAHADEAAKRQGLDFWDRCQVPDARLLKAINDQKLTHADRKSIKDGYLDAKRLSGSFRQLDSVIEQIAFFELMARTEAHPGRREALVDSLGTLRGALTSPT